MNIVFGIVYAIIAGYLIIKFAQLLEKMNHHPLIPLDDVEVSAIRMNPEKPLDRPTYKDQKWGIISYVLILLFILIMFILAFVFKLDKWSLLLILLLPLGHSREFMNMFVVLEDGILIGSQFIPWKKISSFEFKRINVQHKYYGYSKDVNDKGYELIMKQRFFTINCVVLTPEMKEKLTKILSERIHIKNEK